MTTKTAGTETERTPGPWHVGYSGTAVAVYMKPLSEGWLVRDQVARFDRTPEGEANALLIAATPMLEIIADLTGRYMWESLSETFHQQLSQARKAEILAAYRAFAGYREGRLSAEQAWEELAPARNVLAAIEAASPPRKRQITGRSALRVGAVDGKEF